MSLWLTDGMGETGAGGDWGQRVGSEYFLETMNEENVHIVLHELVRLSCSIRTDLSLTLSIHLRRVTPSRSTTSTTGL